MRRVFSFFASLSFGLAVHASMALGQPATMWRDWAPGTEAIAGYAPSFVTLGDRAWFTQSRTQIAGLSNPSFFSTDFWTTDGTPRGTSLLRETSFGPLDSAVALGSQIYFNVSRSVQLYATQNTPDSTQLLFQGNVQCPEGNDETSCSWGLWLLASAGGHLLFVPYHMDTGGWGADVPGQYLGGTFPLYSLDPATGIATQIASLDRPSSVLSLDGLAYYLDDTSLVVSDGTAAGTSTIPLNDTACFSGAPENADGFAGRLKAGRLIESSGAVYAARGCGNLWRVDSASSVSLVATVDGPIIGVIGSRILSTGCAAACGIVVLDVSTGQKSTITPASPFPLETSARYFWQSSGHVFFTESSATGPGSVWSTDGTQGGTHEVLQLPPLASPPVGFPDVWADSANRATPTFVAAGLGDKLFFGWNGDLWSSDGTLGGTADLVNITPGMVLGIAALSGRNGVAIGSQAPTGIQVSFYDAGTGQLTVLEQQPLTGIPSSFAGGQWLAAVGKNLLYDAYALKDSTQQLWSIDGSSAVVLSSGSYDEIPAWRKIGTDEHRVFLMRAEWGRPVMWATDGTVAGTGPISDIGAGKPMMDGDTLYFVSGSHVMRVPPGATTPEVFGDYVNNTSLSVDSNRVVLTGPFPGSQLPAYQPDVLELTSTGTFHVGTVGRSTDAHVMVLGDLLFVTTTDDEGFPFPVTGTIQAFAGGAAVGMAGPSSWAGLVSNTAGPTLLKVSNTRALAWTDSTLTIIDVSGSAVSATPVPALTYASSELAVIGDEAYFVGADSAHGAELYRLASSSVVPQLVADIAPGPEGSNPSGLYRVTGSGPLLFSAYDNAHGSELWMTSGTPATTVLVQDIIPGPNGADPEAFQCANGTIYFTAADDLHGRELWSMPISAVAPGASECESVASGQPAVDAGAPGAASPSADGGIDGGTSDAGATMSAGSRASPVVRAPQGCAATGTDGLAALVLGLLAIHCSALSHRRRKALPRR